MLAQGRFVRRMTPILPEPTGERRGVIGSGPVLRLLIAGDSAGAGVGCEHQRDALLGQLVARLKDHFEVHYQLNARTGDRTKDCIEAMLAMPDQEFDVIATSLGVNDVTSLSTQHRFEQHQRHLITLFQKKFSAKHVMLSGVPPMHCFPALPQPLRWYLGAHARRLDGIVKRLAHQHGLSYLSLNFTNDPLLAASDGFHPGPPAYAMWADSLAARITAEVNEADDKGI